MGYWVMAKPGALWPFYSTMKQAILCSIRLVKGPPCWIPLGWQEILPKPPAFPPKSPSPPWLRDSLSLRPLFFYLPLSLSLYLCLLSLSLFIFLYPSPFPTPLSVPSFCRTPFRPNANSLISSPLPSLSATPSRPSPSQILAQLKSSPSVALPPRPNKLSRSI